MKRVLVTGAAGFIGSHLVDRLLDEGCEVLAIDNLAGGHLGNLEHALTHPNFSFFERDIRNLNSIQSLFEGVDWVFHLAAMADIVPSIQNPLLYHSSNVEGTANVLEACRAHSIKKIVYTASSSCYGIPDLFPTPEHAMMSPQYPYALSKYLGEQMVMHWEQVYGLPAISLRFFNIYGPRARTTGTYGAVFGVFMKQKLEGAPFTVVGDGKQTRDFTYVSDAVDALMTAAQSKQQGKIYNVGSGGTYSINYLVELLGGSIEYLPKRPGEPDCTFADIGKIQSELAWKPQISFEEGVKNMLGHIEYWNEAPLWNKESIADATSDWFKYLSFENESII